MKILIISNMYPNKMYPSYGVFVKSFVEQLVENNFEIKKIVLFKVNINIVKYISYIFFYLKIIILGIIQKYDILYVHYASHNAIPILMLKMLKKNIKIYTNVHGGDVIPEKWINVKLQKYVKKLLLISEKIIVPSSYFKEVVEKKYGIESSKIEIFPSAGIDNKIFYREDSNDKKKYIGFVGRIDKGKGWDVFIKFIDNISTNDLYKDYNFIIVGNGKEKRKLDFLINKCEFDKRIIRYELLPRDELSKIYNKMEIFCFPTMKEESLGLVGLEAMACGVPVIGSNIGGLKSYIINCYNGYLFKPGDVDDLEKKVSMFINMTEAEKNEMILNSVKTAESYSLSSIRNKLLNIFE